MKIELRERTAGHVRVYFEQTQDEQIERMLPRSVESLEQALANFEATLLPGAASFGRTIYADGRYVGDVWWGPSPLRTTKPRFGCWKRTALPCRNPLWRTAGSRSIWSAAVKGAAK